jgi:DNA-binding SARP family transcriptional activator
VRSLEVERPPLPGQRANDHGRRASPEIRVINGFRVCLDGRTLLLPVAAQRVVAFVVLHDEPMLRSYVAGNLWPDVTEQRAAGNLRTTLWRLSRLPALVGSGRRHVWLEPEVTVDFREATEIARRLMVDPDGVSPAASRCPALLGDLLPDWYDEWAIMERERFRELRIHALESIGRGMMRMGKYAAAVQAGLAAARAEPLRESSHRLVVEAHASEGNVAAAMRQFETFRAALKRELGVEPSRLMCSLVDSVLTGAAWTERREAI